MRKSTIITGLDIGSSKISGVIAEMDKAGFFKILAQRFSPSKGVSRGTFVDLDEAIDSVSKVLSKLKNDISRPPENIYVSITGESLKGEKSRGMIPLSLRGREVTEGDMARCVNVASTVQLPYDRDIIHRVIQNFSVDDQPWIKNPLGLYASRLSCEVYVITANINHIQNIYKCVNDTGYDVKKTVFTGMANGESLLRPDDKEIGAAILDIGATLTELSFFMGGALRDMAIIPIGVKDFHGDFKDSGEFEGILSKVKMRIEEYINKGGKFNSITLTGGLSFSDGIIESLEEGLSYPVKMGNIRELRGDISALDSMRAATAIGLTRYAYGDYEKKVIAERNLVKRLSGKVVDIFNNYF